MTTLASAATAATAARRDLLARAGDAQREPRRASLVMPWVIVAGIIALIICIRWLDLLTPPTRLRV